MPLWPAGAMHSFDAFAPQQSQSRRVVHCSGSSQTQGMPLARATLA